MLLAQNRELVKTLKKELRALKKPSMRSSQRHIALYIAHHFEFTPQVPAEELRALCRELEVYNNAVFSYYMADERPLRRGDGKIAGIGWNLTEAGRVAIRTTQPKARAKA